MSSLRVLNLVLTVVIQFVLIGILSSHFVNAQSRPQPLHYLLRFRIQQMDSGAVNHPKGNIDEQPHMQHTAVCPLHHHVHTQLLSITVLEADGGVLFAMESVPEVEAAVTVTRAPSREFACAAGQLQNAEASLRATHLVGLW